MPPAQVAASTDASSDNRMSGDRPPRSSPALLGARELKIETRLCLPAAPRQGDSTDGRAVACALAPPGASCPRLWQSPTCPMGVWRAQPSLGTGSGPRAVCFPHYRGESGHRGGPGAAGRRLPAAGRLASGSPNFYEWAGSELIPVTMHSGTLTTNSI